MTAILKVRDKQTGEFISIPAIKGDTGATPNIALSVTMLDENAEPTVDKSGTAENPTITIGIPSGHIFTFEDFNPAQIELLQQPAIDAAATANSAASNANTKASLANEKAILADQKATAANDAAIAAATAAGEADTAAVAAHEAADTILSSTVATQQANGLMSAADKTKLDTSVANKDLSNVSFVDKPLTGAKISDCTVDKSLASNGFYKAPDGLMIQWGNVINSSATGKIYFPSPSPFTNVFSIATSIKKAGITSMTISVNHDELTNTYFTFDKRGIGPGAVNPAGEPFCYMAIGTWK